VRNLQTGQTIRVSVAADGTQANDDSFQPAISADGSYIAFHSVASNLVPDDTNNVSDVFVHYTGFSSSFPIAINPVTPLPTATPTATPPTATPPTDTRSPVYLPLITE
jgi:hypothetical protein